MYIYYKINDQEIYNIFSSFILNINDDIVYTEKLNLNDEEILVRMSVDGLDKFYLQKIDKEKYRLNKIVNFENAKIKFIVNTNDKLEEILTTSNLIRDIKLERENIAKYFIIDNFKGIDCLNNTNSINYIKKSNIELENIIDKYKGFLYGVLKDKHKVSKFMLDYKAKIYKEYNDIILIENQLKEKKASNSVKLSIKKLKNQMIKEINSNLINSSYDDLIFENIQNKKIKLNNTFFKLSDFDLKLYEYIISKLIYSLKNISNEKEKSINIVKHLKGIHPSIEEDIKKINKRITDEDFTINVNDIENNVIKNLYVALIKIDNLKEVNTFIERKNIDNYFMIYSFIGVIKGFKKVSGSFFDYDNYNMKIVKDSIKTIEKSTSNKSMMKRNYRLKLTYLGLKTMKSVNDGKYSNHEFNIIKSKEKMIIEVNRENARLEIAYYRRGNNMAKTIRYFDNKIKQIEYIDNKFKYDGKVYLRYKFIINNKVKVLDFNYEYIFSSILENILKEKL